MNNIAIKDEVKVDKHNSLKIKLPVANQINTYTLKLNDDCSNSEQSEILGLVLNNFY